MKKRHERGRAQIGSPVVRPRALPTGRARGRPVSPVGQAYAAVLRSWERQALADAVDLLLDEWWTDLEDLHRGAPFASCGMAIALPAWSWSRCSAAFARQFLLCTATVAWKLAQPQRYRLACVGEELAAWAIHDQAKAVLEDRSEPGIGRKQRRGIGRGVVRGAFNAFVEQWFEDLDFLWLFDPASDGLDRSPVGEHLGALPLDFSSWFINVLPARAGALHPYYDRGAYSVEGAVVRARPTVGQAYRGLLAEPEQAAVAAGIRLILDETMDALLAREPQHRSAHTALARYWPARALSVLSPLVAKAFLLTLSTVAWKLAQPRRYPLSSAAEQLALHALLTRARAWLDEAQGGRRTTSAASFTAFERHFVRKESLRTLFEGPPGDPSLERLAAEAQRWFAPFPALPGARPGTAVHPYRPDC